MNEGEVKGPVEDCQTVFVFNQITKHPLPKHPHLPSQNVTRFEEFQIQNSRFQIGCRKNKRISLAGCFDKLSMTFRGE